MEHRIADGTYEEDPPRVQDPKFHVPCSILLPKDTATFQTLIDKELVSASVAEKMHRVWFDEQTGWVQLLS